jgi:hypothetical protein
MKSKKEEKDNRMIRDNKSRVTGKKPENISDKAEEEFKKSKLRNKGKASNANLGGSYADTKGKKKLL